MEGGGGVTVASLPAPAQLSITCSKAVDLLFMRRKSLGMRLRVMRLGAMSDQINLRVMRLGGMRLGGMRLGAMRL